MTNTRNILGDRQQIIDHVRNTLGADGVKPLTWVRRESWMRSTDIDALVREGKLAKEVRREWDQATGYQANMFGGAAVMQRRRMYLKAL